MQTTLILVGVIIVLIFLVRRKMKHIVKISIALLVVFAGALLIYKTPFTQKYSSFNKVQIEAYSEDHNQHLKSDLITTPNDVSKLKSILETTPLTRVLSNDFDRIPADTYTYYLAYYKTDGLVELWLGKDFGYVTEDEHMYLIKGYSEVIHELQTEGY